MRIKNVSPFNTSALIQSIASKYNEIVDNTAFELMVIANEKVMVQVNENGYRYSYKQEGMKTTLGLWKEDKHIMTYIVYFDVEDNKIKRKRLVNDLEHEEEFE